MAFNVFYYQIKDDPRCLTKTLIDTGANKNLVTSQQIEFKQGHDIHNLTITNFTNSGASSQDYINYVKITKVGDATYGPFYYFVDDIIVSPTKHRTFKLRLDVLMTYSTQLKALTVTLERSESDNNGYLPDGEYAALGYRAIVCKAFSKGLETDSFVLMTTG